MLSRCLISFSFAAFLFVGCQTSTSTDGESSMADTETSAQADVDEAEDKASPWQAKKRNFSPENELEAEIIRLQDSLDKANYEDRLDIESMESAIAKMKEHGLLHTNHPRSSAYLLRAGDYAQGLRHFEEAIEILGIILEKYPDSYEYIDALYYTGYIYDRQKKEYKNAVKYYERFLRELPTDDLAPQVQAHLNRVQTILENEKNDQ